MADTDIKYKVGVEADESSAIQTGKDIMKNVEKGIGNNGYIKLPVEITKFKYPKQTQSKDGISRGVDYSELQKAQNKLISNWNKLSKEGFSSRDEDILAVLKSFREYQKAVKNQYGNTTNDTKDETVMAIRRTIGDSLKKHFIRLAPATLANGHRRFIHECRHK